jgi:hypothetical protein
VPHPARPPQRKDDRQSTGGERAVHPEVTHDRHDPTVQTRAAKTCADSQPGRAADLFRQAEPAELRHCASGSPRQLARLLRLSVE